MARIRTIKPEFPQSESIGRLSRDARLLFVQLWTIVDDEGRARGASRMLASLLYPYDDDAASLIDGWISELEAAGKVRLYEVDGSTYIDIPNWLEHQKIDKPSKSRLPAFVDGSRIVANVREASTTDLGPSILDLGPGPIGSLRSPCAVAKATRTPPVPSELFDRFWSTYPKRGSASNPRKPAVEKFSRLVKAGADPEAIIAGAQHYAEVERQAGRAGTEKIAQAITWLNQERWRDYAEVVSVSLADFEARLPSNLHPDHRAQLISEFKQGHAA
jgi:hypothetical protein